MFSNSAELLKNLITKTNNHYIDSEIVITENTHGEIITLPKNILFYTISWKKTPKKTYN